MDITRNFAIADNKGDDDYWNQCGLLPLPQRRQEVADAGLQRGAGRHGVEIVKRLIPQCDIVVESFTPHVMAKFGLDYESLTAIRPDIIMISMSGYGQNGPWKDFSAYGMGLEPASGISSLTGYRGGDPLRTRHLLHGPLHRHRRCGRGAGRARLPAAHRQGPVHRPLGARGGDPDHRLRADGLRDERAPARRASATAAPGTRRRAATGARATTTGS